MLFSILVILALVFAILSIIPGVPGPIPWLGVAVVLIAVALLLGPVGGLALGVR